MESKCGWQGLIAGCSIIKGDNMVTRRRRSSLTNKWSHLAEVLDCAFRGYQHYAPGLIKTWVETDQLCFAGLSITVPFSVGNRNLQPPSYLAKHTCHGDTVHFTSAELDDTLLACRETRGGEGRRDASRRNSGSIKGGWGQCSRIRGVEATCQRREGRVR